MTFKQKILTLSKSRAGRNAASSYLAVISTTFTGLISIPLAVHFLNREELGLWAIITVFAGYLGQMELGIGVATGRMMADSIIEQDKVEIDRWWTLTRIILGLLGLLIIIVGFAAAPLYMSQMADDYPDRNEALFLYLAIVIMQGIKMPFQGAEGILTAQNRFHWIPLRQCLIFWVELIVIATCLFAGLKLYAMLWSQVSIILVSWSANWFLLSKSQPKLGWNFTGLDRARVRKIFGFSLNISGLSFVQVFTRSLPVLLLGKFGGLQLIPVYTLTNKASTVLVTIGIRMYQSFYPNLQRMFIAGDLDGFSRKLPKVGILTIASSLAVAGFLLCLNRMAVGVLAKPEFYAGSITTTWFAVAAITIPLSAFLQMPMFVAGKMGKSFAASLLQLLVGVGLSLLAFRSYGMDGLAAVSAILPLILGAYGYIRSGSECGFRSWTLFGPVVIWGGGAIILTITGGYLISILPPNELVVELFSKNVPLPGWPEIMVGGSICLIAAVIFIQTLRKLRTGLPSIKSISA